MASATSYYEYSGVVTAAGIHVTQKQRTSTPRQYTVTSRLAGAAATQLALNVTTSVAVIKHAVVRRAMLLLMRAAVLMLICQRYARRAIVISDDTPLRHAAAFRCRFRHFADYFFLSLSSFAFDAAAASFHAAATAYYAICRRCHWLS